MKIPPLPPGFELEQPSATIPPPPPGFELEQEGAPARTAGGIAGGLGLDLLSGAQRAAKAPFDLINMLGAAQSKLPLPLQLMLDPMGTRGEVTQAAEAGSDFFQEGIDAARELRPESYAARRDAPIFDRAEDGSVTDWNMPTPEAIAGTVTESLPMIPQMIAGGGGLSGLLQAMGMARGAGALGFGLSNAANVAPMQFDEVRREAAGELLGRAAFEGREPTDEEVTADRQRSLDQGLTAGALTSLLSTLTGAGGFAAASRMGMGASSLPGALAKGFMADAPFEGVEEAGQSVVGDIAREREIDLISAAEGGILGFSAGGAPGAAIGGMQYAQGARGNRPAPAALNPQQQPDPTLPPEDDADLRGQLARAMARQQQPAAPAQPQGLGDFLSQALAAEPFQQRAQPEASTSVSVDPTVRPGPKPDEVADPALLDTSRRWEPMKGPNGQQLTDAQGRPKRKPVLDYDKGDGLREWIERMRDTGWMPEGDLDMAEAADMVMRAINGEQVFHPYEGAGARLAREAEQDWEAAQEKADQDLRPLGETSGRVDARAERQAQREDIRDETMTLAEQARRWAADNPAPTEDVAPVFSRKDTGPAPPKDSPAWRKFTADTKVRDADGNVIPLYHGTGEDFTVFDDAKSGDSTQHSTAPLGHFLTPNRELAEGYARNASDGRPADERVIEAWVAINNPYTMTLEDMQSIDSPDAARAVRGWLQSQGFDGIHVPEADNWIAFESGQVKDVGNRGTFDRADPDIMLSRKDVAESQPAFYSAAVRAIEEGKGAPKRAGADSWKQWLDGAVRRGDMKQSERDWLGIDAWLDSQPGQVTREALADFVRANEVQVSEVQLGATNEPAIQRKIDALNDEYNAILDENRIGSDGRTVDDLPADAKKRIAEITKEYDALADQISNERQGRQAPKFANYRIPGGENYRELLLTLPTKPMSLETLNKNRRSWGNAELSWGNAELSQAEYDARLARGEVAPSADAAYRSGHWDQPNVLAHVRFDERTDADGKRVLFLNEVQSDWHQEGRKKGYKTGDAKLEFRPNGRVIPGSTREGVDVYDNGSFVGRWASEREARADLADHPNYGGNQRVPNAPLKGTDEWAMAAFKRMARWAVDNGFDRIAWVTGEQAADMFDLSKQIDYISARRRGDRVLVRTSDVSVDRQIQSSGNGEAYTKGGGGTLMTDAQIEAVFGKDYAARILEAAEQDGGGTLEGDGLKVGGEGMRGFYDKILPAAVNKWGKRFGVRVGRAEIEVKEATGNALGAGRTAHEVIDPQGQIYDAFDTRQAALDAAEDAGPGYTVRSPDRGSLSAVPAIDITDSMREAVAQGQPLFRQTEPNAPAQETSIPPNLPAALDEDTRALSRTINRAIAGPGQQFRARTIAQDSLPDALRGALAALESATGTRAVVFRNLTPDVVDFNGVTTRNGVSYVNETAQSPITTVAAHEWVHNLRATDPDLYALLEAEIARQGMLPEYAAKLRRQGDTNAENNALEELTADAVGDAMTDRTFLERMAREAGDLFKRVADSFMRYLDGLLGRTKDLGSNAYLRDVQAFRDVLADVLKRAEGRKAGKAAAEGASDLAFQRVWHGTPHRGIEKEGFKLNKIGTGEGAQAYGYGMYFAGRREVADYYRVTLSDGTGEVGAVIVNGNKVEPFSPEGHAARLLFYNDAREIKAAAKSWLKEARAGEKWAEEIAKGQGLSAVEYYERLNQFLANHKRKDIKVERGQLYAVEIPEDSELLDYGSPMSRQNAKVQDAARAFLRSEGHLREGENGPRQLQASFNAAAMELGGMARGGDGQTLYEMLAKRLGSEQAASLWLNEHGIPGLRFKAGQIAMVKGGGHNYVIWDEALLTPEAAQITPMFSRAPAVDSAEFREWFGDSAVVDANGAPLGMTADEANEAQARGDIRFSRKTPQQAAGEKAQLRQQAARDLPQQQGTPGWNYDTSGWEGIKGQARQARAKLQDKMIAWRDVQQQIESQLKQAIPDAQNVYRMENLMHGRVKEGLDRMERDQIVPLIEAMRKAKVKPEALEEYLYARHAQERNAEIAKINPRMPDGGSGMANAEAKAILAKADRAKLDPLAAMVDRMVKGTRRRLLQHGLITQDQFDAMDSQYASYVPLRGKTVGPTEEAAMPTTAGRGVDGRRSPVREALGRGAGNRAKDILAEIIGDAQRSIILAEKARVGRTVMRLVLANPNPDLWTVEPVQTERKKDANGKVYEAVVNDWSDPTVVGVRVRGQLYKVQMNVPLAQALTNVGIDQLSSVTRFAGSINRYLSAVLTKYNPSFLGVNATRDAIFGLTGLAAEHGELVALDAAIHYPQAAIAAGRQAAGKPGSGQWGRWAQEFAEAGGKTGYVAMPSVEELQRMIGKGSLSSYSPTGIAKVARGLADVVGIMNDAVENALRLSAYVSLRKRGMSAEKAAAYAKDLTVNFNRKGLDGAKLNAWFLFYNAAVQGAKRVGDVLRKPKAWGYLGSMVALQTVAALFAMGLEDDDGENLWAKVPDHAKRRNIVIVTPDKGVIMIPMPYGFNWFVYSPTRVMEAMLSEDPSSPDKVANVVGDLTGALVESFSPVPLDDGAMGVLPTVLRYPINLQANRSDFGTPIRREDPYAKSALPRASMGRPDTLEVFKLGATGLNRLGGGDDYTPPVPLLDFAPEDLEYMLKTATGGAGSFVVDVATLGQKMAGEFPIEARDVPLSKRFYQGINEEASQQAIYYQRRETIDRSLRKVRAAFREQGQAEAERMLKSMPELQGARFRRNANGKVVVSSGSPQLVAARGSLYETYRETEKAVRARSEAMKQAYDSAPASLLPNEKTRERERRMREENAKRMEAQRAFNAAWNRVVLPAAE